MHVHVACTHHWSKLWRTELRSSFRMSDELKSSFPSPRLFVRERVRDNEKLGAVRAVARCTRPPCCPSANLRNANKRNKGEIAKSALYKLLAIQLEGQPACLHICTCAAGRWKIKSARKFAATGTLTFYRIPQPVEGVRCSWLDEQKAVVEAEKSVQCSFSTEHHGA